MVKSGALVNPLSIKFPTADPVPAAERPAFEAVRDWQLSFLTTVAPPVGTVTSSTALTPPAP